MRRLNINIFLVTILFFLNFYTNTVANISSKFINDITNKASEILSSQNTRELKIKELIKISQESGRKYMNVASAFFGESKDCKKKD